MAVFYWTETNPDTEDGEDIKIYELASTSRITISSPAKVTSSPVEDGSSIVDNYYLDNKTATFSGVITNINVSRVGATNLPTDQWITDVRALRQSKKLLTVFADTEVIQNCLITRFDLEKTKDQGLTGWLCNMSFKEVDISERAKIVEIKKPKAPVKDEVAPKSRGSSSSVKEVELTETNFGGVLTNARSFFTGGTPDGTTN